MNLDLALLAMESGQPVEEAIVLLEVDLNKLGAKDRELAIKLEKLIKDEKAGRNSREAIHHWNTQLLGLYNKAKPAGYSNLLPPEKRTSVLQFRK